MFMMYTFCRLKMMHIQNVYSFFVDKMYPTFRQTFVYNLYTNFIQNV